MRVFVTCEHRFLRTPDHQIWTETAFAYRYWKRYLGVFSSVHVIARVSDIVDPREVSHVKSRWKNVEGEGIEVLALPFYLGPIQYLKVQSKIKNLIRRELNHEDKLILVLPSPISLLVRHVAFEKKISYGVEILGDPWEVFSKHGLRHPLRVYFRYRLTWLQKSLVSKSTASLFVTQTSLQKRYPPRNKFSSFGVSNVELSAEHLAKVPRQFNSEQLSACLNLICIGSLEQMYKSPDVVLQAMALAKQNKLTWKLTWIGGGKFLEPMQNLALRLGVENQVAFLGPVAAGEDVRRQLDQADLFVLASLTEGLPRAMIEAMSRGLPCVGSNVGGIPELLDQVHLVEAGNAEELFSKIKWMQSDAKAMSDFSRLNLDRSRFYLDEYLDQKRQGFLSALAEL
ncbi:MAG: glycosyltransferase [Pseudobdellovibrionaceae bacterium]